MKERFLKIILSMHHAKRDYTLAVSEEAFSPKKFADTMNQISHNLKTNGCIYFYETVVDHGKIPHSLKMTVIVAEKTVFERRIFFKEADQKPSSDFIKELTESVSTTIRKEIIEGVIASEEFKTM